MSQGWGNPPQQPPGSGFGAPPPSGGGYGAPPPGGGGYGAPPGGGGFGPPPGGGFGPPQQSQSASGMAITALILGIGSWVACGLLFSIPGAIIGKMEMSKIARGESPEAGKGLAVAGFWISIVNIVIYVLVGILWCVIMIIGMATAPSSGSYNY